MTLRPLLHIAFLCAVLSCLVSCKENASTENDPIRDIRNGIDLSHYQGVIDWDSLSKDTAIGFVYVKASEGTDVQDGLYQYNVTWAKHYGFIVGAYHYFIPTVSPYLQFKNFRSKVAPSTMDLAPIVDVETTNGMPMQEFRDSLHIFLDLIEKEYKIKPVIYTLWAFYHEAISGHFPDYKLMIARYCEKMPTLNDTADYIIWQHKCDGQKLGIKRKVDLNVVTDNHSIEEIMYERSIKKFRQRYSEKHE